MTAQLTRTDSQSTCPSRQVLSELPVRVILFLRTVARSDVIRATMQRGGYGPADHNEGRQLLNAICEYPRVALDHSADERARSALNAVDQYVRAHFARYRAAIERHYPNFAHLIPLPTSREPAAALQAMRALLNWLDKGESADKNQIVQTLTQRGLDLDERQRLVKLVELAGSVNEPEISHNFQDNDTREQALLSLYRWYSDWTTTARTLIKRKDHRNSLGIGERQPRRSVDG
jgi:hypothetical protein